MFDEFMRDFPFLMKEMKEELKKSCTDARGKNLMKTDVKERQTRGMSWKWICPDFTKDEVKVSLENGYLTIQAAKGLDQDEQEKRILDAISAGAVCRSL